MVNYLQSKNKGLTKEFKEIREAVLNLDIMPSMRLMMSAGEACDRDNIAAYNCSYLAMNNKRAFSEALYILMNGTGVGFSCERQEISKLPAIPEDISVTTDTIVVGDSKLGWAKSFKKLLSSLWEGDIPTVDYSNVRPAGARLKTFGGRASGPEPLKRLFDFVVESFIAAKGRKLTSLEVHDIVCMVGEIVVVGGVRRSALISLSNLTDKRMREAKMGAWYNEYAYRGLANNSVAYTEKPDMEVFMEEWLSLVKSKSGERGIFNRVASQSQAIKQGREPDLNYGTNPCSEIILRDKQFCNLTEVVVRANDTKESLKNKIRLATILGTLQSNLTKFQFLSAEWVKNTKEERLLGVSLTGIMDAKITSNPDPKFLEELRDEANKVNKKYAKILGIEESKSITCVKPSGTVSQLVDSASGIHSRHSPYYIRTIRMDKKDSIYQFLKDKGVQVEDEAFRPDSTAVFSFPIKSPTNAITRDDRTALEELENWLIYQRHFCNHKPSVTINVREHEWMEVGAWVYKYFDEISGISFLPHSDHSYQQAPYQECTKEEYQNLLVATPSSIDWSTFKEEEDNTEGSQTLACTGNACEIT
jgi:ribonucleoside-diphosphate reductase alpha chain